MAKFRPSLELRKALSSRANGRCEYCPEAFSPQIFSVEHINPESRGGNNDSENLALSCQGCNGFKSNKTKAIDPTTGLSTPLFHPRLHKWKDHFNWD
jgi:5-methylcytosine-specific restriction endonuclease McrA